MSGGPKAVESVDASGRKCFQVLFMRCDGCTHTGSVCVGSYRISYNLG